MVKIGNTQYRPRKIGSRPTRDLAYEMRALKYVIAAADHGSFSAEKLALLEARHAPLIKPGKFRPPSDKLMAILAAATSTKTRQ